jgi:hypothetical protein
VLFTFETTNMKKNDTVDSATRVKRPRIHRATVPGEPEKVNILYEVTHAKNGQDKPVQDEKNLNYTIQREQNAKNS